MYGKLMSINDDLMWKYYVFLTDLRQSEVDALQAEVAAGKLHPMEAKKRLARSIVADFHGEAAALVADENWARMFQQKETAEDLEEVFVSHRDVARITPNDPDLLEVKIPKLLVQMGLAASGTEANRKIAEGAVRMDGKTLGLVFYVERRVLPIRRVVRLGKRAKVAVIG
jgi:tyrosyl-tRNA synthetase